MRNIKTITLFSFLLLTVLPALCIAGQQPTVEEQVLLERVNAARLHQAEESRRLNVDFQEGMSTPVSADLQPLIWRAGMQAAAAEHNTDMWTRGYYGHVTPDGLAPFAQVQKHDSDFIAVGQNLGAGRMYTGPDAVYAGWMIDVGITGRGHRQTILHSKINTFGAQRSSSANTFYGVYWTAYFGVTLSDTSYVTGVIYRDLNRNGRYDEGEGLPKWKVRLIPHSPADTGNPAASSQPISTSVAAATAAEPEFTSAYDTGGYALPAPAEGDYTVEAVSPSGEAVFATTGVGEANVKVDFVIQSSRTAAATGSGGNGRKMGCTVSLPGNSAWRLLLIFGALCAVIFGLRVTVRN